MREYIIPTIGSLVIIISVIWFCLMSIEVVDCDNYEYLTGTKNSNDER